MRRRLLFLILAFLYLDGWSQDLVQTVRGVVLDLESKSPLIGATIVVFADSAVVGGCASKENGEFVMSSIPVGYITIRASCSGYKERWFERVAVTSGKEVVFPIELEESIIELGEIEIKATRDGEALNEMSLVSSRQFSVEETNRYAGSRGDPARMASNFAGVQGADDSRNDIVIRGNSPQGVLWRMEGVDMPNPNHFAIPGTAGGPVSIINNKYLANSDFFTGAFPSEYGNSVAGVFDLRMRNGNNQKHEFTGQFGFLGTELFAEGPLSKKTRASYLLSYRYSTLQLFSLLGINIGTNAVPKYQDAAFRVNLPMNRGANLSFWGLGGASSVDILISNQKTPDERNIYGENDRDQYFKSSTGIAGMTYSKSISENTFIKSTVAANAAVQRSFHALVYRHLSEGNYVVDSMVSLLNYRFREAKTSFSLLINHKLSKRGSLRFGILVDHYFWNYVDSVRVIDTTFTDYYKWTIRWKSKKEGFLVQPYIQWKQKLSDRITMSVGWHLQYFSLSNSLSAMEPRIALRWQMNDQSTLSLGAGRHSQLQPTYMYFYNPGLKTDIRSRPINEGIGFTKSDHLVLSYERIEGHWRFKSEAYYQRLFEIPVEKKSSGFSLVNTGAGFTRFFPDTLVNKGTAQNVGLEFTMERFYFNGWIFLFTASLFDSHYVGSDGVKRNTDFNGRYTLNILASKEWLFKRGKSLSIGSKVTTAGGRWYGPADIAASNQARDLVYVDSLRNTLQFNPYFRFDLKINFKLNKDKLTHEIGLDLVNVLNTKNVLKLTFAPDENASPANSIRKEYQLGFLPIFYYRIDF